MKLPKDDVPRARSEVMRAVRSKNTKPELAVRGMVHAAGYRYRLHRKDLPGTPDLVFGPRRKLIFVHGCFWHRHPDRACPLSRLPKSRLEFWLPKLDGNRKRDLESQDRLQRAGWEILTIWECELRNLDKISEQVLAFLGPR
jgi:DNA mismatch endonuclease (patch repair protein)